MKLINRFKYYILLVCTFLFISCSFNELRWEDITDVEVEQPTASENADIVLEVTLADSKSIDMTIKDINLQFSDNNNRRLCSIEIDKKIKLVSKNQKIRLPLLITMPGGTVRVERVMDFFKQEKHLINIKGYVKLKKGVIVKKVKFEKAINLSELLDF